MLSIGGLGQMLPAWALLPLLWLGGVALAITRRRVDRPLAAMRMLIYRNRFWLLRVMLFMAVIFPLARAVTAYKSAIPQLVPFYADPFLLAADKLIFGTDPWRLTHAVIGPIGTMIIDRIYALWFVVMMLLIGWLNFTRDRKLQLRGLFTYLLSWALLGNFLATALSSVGPCFYSRFYHSDHFEPLMRTLMTTNEEHRLFALGAMNYLLSSIGKDRLGAGISAMPSMHVAIAFLCFLVTLQGTKHLWLKLSAAAFALTIFIGSIHLGWHYAVDSIVAILAVTMIWICVGRFVDWLSECSQVVELGPVAQF
jgi:hypothetical protein